MPIKAPKAATAADWTTLEQLPNVGPAIAADLRLLGIVDAEGLRGKDACVLYQRLCAVTGQRHDPCVLDTFMAVADFMRGAPAAPWWDYTAKHKALVGQVRDSGMACDPQLVLPHGLGNAVDADACIELRHRRPHRGGGWQGRVEMCQVGLRAVVVT